MAGPSTGSRAGWPRPAGRSCWIPTDQARRPRSTDLQANQSGHVEDQPPFVVGRLEVDDRLDAPVVVSLRIAEDLLHLPGALALLDDQHLWAAGVGSGVDGLVLAEVRRQ